MANLASAEKRNRQNERNRAANRARRSRLKSDTRRLLDAVSAGDAAKAADALHTVTKRLDQTAAKGTLHRNTAARRKSRLARRVNALKTAKASA